MVAVVAKVIGALLVVVSAYFYGYHQGQNMEELNHARTQITTLERAIEEHKAKQANDAQALSDLRIAESRARDEYEWMRGQLAILESRASKNNASGSCIRFQRLAVEKEQLLNEAQRGLEFCYKNHK